MNNNYIILFVFCVMIIPQILLHEMTEDDIIFIKGIMVLNATLPNIHLFLISILLIVVQLMI